MTNRYKHTNIIIVSNNDISSPPSGREKHNPPFRKQALKRSKIPYRPYAPYLLWIINPFILDVKQNEAAAVDKPV